MSVFYEERRERLRWRNESTRHNTQIEMLDPFAVPASGSTPRPGEATQGPSTVPTNSAPIPEASSTKVFEDILAQLDNAGNTWGDFIEWVSDPFSSCPAHNRYDGFFRNKEQVHRVLTHWVSRRNCKTGREEVHKWTVKYLCRQISREGDTVTKSNLLQSRTMPINQAFVSGFSLLGLYRKLSMMCPITTSLLRKLATTPRQEPELAKNENTEQRKQHVSVQ